MGIVLIGLVAAACIAGSLVASNEDLGVDYGREYVFHTWWFLGLMGLLLVNLCLCSWEKSYIALTLYRKRNFQTNAKFYEKAGHSIAFPWNGSLEHLDEKLGKKYTVSKSSGAAFYSQKGLFGRAGATIIHIGLLWTMAAGFYRILSDDFGWGVYDATIILPEGQVSSTYVTRKDRLKEPAGENLKPVAMPFALRNLDFNAEYFPHSTVAKSFASLVELSDGDYRRIYEVSMTNPVIYDGFKITQNSFSANERIQRGKFRITDTSTGDYTEADAMPGDPVRLRGLGDNPLFIQVESLSPDTRYHILNLDQQKVIEDGAAMKPEELPIPIDTRVFADELADSRYSVMIGALFPNFTFDENKQPTTRDETFDNPAVMVMLFKNGRPNGYTWLFLNPEAQKIVGQPHPEVSLTFENYRRKANGTTATATLYDYEVNLKIVEKASSKDVGEAWLSAGQLHELDVSNQLLKSANIRMDRLGETHATSETATAAATTSSPMSEKSSPVISGTIANDSETSDTIADTQGRYQVEFMGMEDGHVTFLGFMRDPSVGWLFAGCIIIIFGTMTAFIFVYREIWCYYDKQSGLMYMATAVRGTSPSAHREFDQLVEEIKGSSKHLIH